jgi:hypothetical protein
LPVFGWFYGERTNIFSLSIQEALLDCAWRGWNWFDSMAARLVGSFAAGVFWLPSYPGCLWEWDMRGLFWMKIPCAGTTASLTPILRPRGMQLTYRKNP